MKSPAWPPTSTTRVLVNQNYHAAWRSSIGEVEDHHGLLSVVVPAGDHRLGLRYRDPWITAGAVIWALAVLALLALLGSELRAGLNAWSQRWQALPW